MRNAHCGSSSPMFVHSPVISSTRFFSHHIISCPYPATCHMVVLSSEHKVKAPLQLIKYVFFTWAETKFKKLQGVVLVCDCLHISFLVKWPMGKRQHERELPNNSQESMATGMLDELSQGLCRALAFSGMRCGNYLFSDSVLFKNENCCFTFLKHSLHFCCSL